MSDLKSPVLSGRWRNQLGSEMDLSIGPDGRISGRFRSAVGTVAATTTYALAGFARGDLLAFCVGFDGHGVAAWVGQHTERQGKERLVLLWQLAHDIPDDREASWLWSGVRAGSDTFTRA
jgi:hypothetical protein